jgi:hypothetical protein
VASSVGRRIRGCFSAFAPSLLRSGDAACARVFVKGSFRALFDPTVLFSRNKPAITNQPAVLFSEQTSHQPNEQAFLETGSF